ncbi:MAG: helix-turn-helix domain containing protein [Bacteroidales bacterium]|nr:helix-turn-helix domain containing protein [Bacteroidales bacterium]MDT8430198.1 helix-turn-helix domain-containing protein [Bacteroidales bacterium]
MRTKDTNKADLIFKAGLALITKEGIAGVTMSKLAAKAGMATGTLYIYFRSKETLLRKLYEKLNRESSARFMKGYDTRQPFAAGLKRVWLNYLNHRITHHDESVFLEQYYRSPYISADELQIAESMKAPVHQMIRRGKEEQFIREDVDDEMLFLAMLGFIRELADEHVSGVYVLDEARIEKAFQISWEAIKR